MRKILLSAVLFMVTVGVFAQGMRASDAQEVQRSTAITAVEFEMSTAEAVIETRTSAVFFEGFEGTTDMTCLQGGQQMFQAGLAQQVSAKLVHMPEQEWHL